MISSSRAAGFTLVEVITSIGIFTVIIVAVGAFEMNIFRYHRSASGSFSIVQDAQLMLRSISKDIRMASQGSDGSYAFQTTATNTLTFFADSNGDGVKERIRYSLIGSKFYKAVLVPTGSPLSYTGVESTSTILADIVNGTSSAFTYFSGAYTGTSTGALNQPVSPAAVRLVQVSLTFDGDINDNVPARTYIVDVTPRNIKDNL